MSDRHEAWYMVATAIAAGIMVGLSVPLWAVLCFVVMAFCLLTWAKAGEQ